MAIVIPSKNIYDKNNNIIRNNLIDKVEIAANNVETITDSGNVYNEDVIANSSNLNTEALQSDIEGKSFVSVSTPSLGAIAYLELTPTYLTANFTIPKSLKNAIITQLLTGIDENDNTNIQYSLYGNYKNGIASGEIYVSSINGYGDYTFGSSNPTNITISNVVTNDTANYNLDSIENSYSVSNTASTGLVTTTATAEVNLSITDTVSIATAIENENDYEITLKFYAGLKIIKLGQTQEVPIAGETYHLTGTYEEYVPAQINVSFYGTTIEIELQEENIVVGNGKKSFSISSNELIQDTNTYNSITIQRTVQIQIGEVLESVADRSLYKAYLINGTLDIYDNLEYNGEVGSIQYYYNNYGEEYYAILVPTNGEFANSSGTITANVVTMSTENAVTEMGNSILNQYKNGLQNATVLCSISDYYDENGNLVITKDGSKDMVFRMHDEVIPYVYSANGTDIPMALKQDGSPKVFRVIGIKIYYDGAVWQELTLKEIADN